MPWCPKCRNEYRAGFTVCADCGVELVEKLGEKEEKKSSLFTASVVDMDHLMEFLKASDIKGVSVQDNGDGTADLMVEDKHRKEVSFAVKTYSERRREEMEEYAVKQQERLHEVFGDEDDDDEDEEEEITKDSDDFDDDSDEDSDEEEAPEKEKIYRSSKEKADDAKNSAIALCLMGVLGLTFEALVVFHVLPLQINGTSGKVLYAFLAAVFLVLIVSGILSFFTAKRLRANIVDESKLKEDILAFCRLEAVETANKMIPSSDKEDESIYFARIDFLKSAIKREPKFQNVDDVTIDGLLDENYQNLFG